MEEFNSSSHQKTGENRKKKQPRAGRIVPRNRVRGGIKEKIKRKIKKKRFQERDTNFESVNW